jgi:hypothetical protein
MKRQAAADGDLYVNPFNRRKAKRNQDEFVYHALVVAGGRVTESRDVKMVLNQPSWTRSREIADRINERFPARPGAKNRTAEPQNDVLIRLHVPPAYQSRTDHFVNLVNHLYTQRSPNFATQQAERLAERLKADPSTAERVALAWQALGRTIIPLLRRFYDADTLPLRMAALEAGARLEDERASDYLDELANHQDPGIRQRVAEALVHMPSSLRGSQTLKKLLNDSEQSVRVKAYESLATINDPILNRTPVRDKAGNLKFLIDRVPSDKPLVYVTPSRVPRIAIFSRGLAFDRPLLARIWDNHLMLRSEPDREKIKLFYQKPGQPQGKTYDVPPNLAQLVYRLAHEPTVDRPGDGLGLSYSRAVDAVYQLCKQGHIPAPIEVKISELAERVEGASRVNPRRPEKSPGPADMLEEPATRPAVGESAAQRPATGPQRGDQPSQRTAGP